MSLEKNSLEYSKSASRKIISAWALSLALLLSNHADAGWLSDHVKVNYDADYYQKYNDNLPRLENSNLQSWTKFSVSSGRLYADWVELVLTDSEDEYFSAEALKEFDLEELAVNVDWKHYKAKPMFKSLYFQRSWTKHGLGYKIWRKISIVYVPYNWRILVLWSVSQGQYIEENKKKEYFISSFESNKKQVLNRVLQLLWWSNTKGRDIQADANHNNYFYHNWNLRWVLQNFWNEKILIRWTWASGTVVAKLMVSNWNFLLMSPSWKVLYQAQWSNIWISLETLDYYIDLNLNN